MESEAPTINVWEKEKRKAKEAGLQLVVRGPIFYVEKLGTEAIYYQTSDLASLNTYLSGYCCGRRDAAKS